MPGSEGNKTMNAKRINLVACVRAALESAGYSTVAVVNAVNAELGRLEQGKGGKDASLGDGKLTKSEYKVTEQLGSTNWHGARTPGLEFDAWHSAMAKANKIGEMDSCFIPTKFTAWLQFAKAPALAAPAAGPIAVDPALAAKANSKAPVPAGK